MAKKLNTKLATLLVGGGLAVGAAALVGPQVARVLHRSAGDPQRLVSQGDDAMQKGDWEAAEGFYKIAASIDPNNTDTLVKYGNALERLTLKEPTYLQLRRSQWDKAVSIDPRCTPALERLLKSYWDQLELSARADLFGQVRVVADKLLAVHPGDIKVLGKKYIATVRQWRQTSTVSRPEASATVDAMQELIKKDPENAELPLHYADARVEQGREAIDGANRIEGDRLFLDAKSTMTAACAAHPDSAAFHFYAYKIYRQLADTDPKGNPEKKEAVKERVEEYAKLADDALNRARRWRQSSTRRRTRWPQRSSSRPPTGPASAGMTRSPRGSSADSTTPTATTAPASPWRACWRTSAKPTPPSCKPTGMTPPGS